MIRTFKSVVTLLLLFVMISSCQKEISEDFVNNSNNNNNNNNNNNVDCKACNYYPMCDSSTYTYVDTSSTGTGTPITQTLDHTGDTTMDGKLFQILSSGAGTPLSYHNCTTGITTIAGFPTANNRVTQTILKVNEPVGTSWTNVNSNMGQSFDYIWTVVDKNLTKTVLGNTYSNVIQMHLTLSADIMGTTLVLAESDYYYAPNVGLIDNITYDYSSGSPVMTLHRVLQSHYIP